MTRATNAAASKRRKAKVLKLAKGFRGPRRKTYRLAAESVQRAMAFSYKGRKLKKRDFRSLWIVRIGAKAKEYGLSYSKFIDGLKRAKVLVNRKILAELAVNNDNAFAKLVEIAKQS